MGIAYTGQELNDSTAIISATVNSYQTTAVFNLALHDVAIVGVRAALGGVSNLTGMTDTAGNTYTRQAREHGSNDPWLEIWVCLDCLAGTGVKLNLAGSGSFSFGWLEAVAFSGGDNSTGFDVAVCKYFSPGSTTHHTTDAFNAAANDSLIVLFGSSNNFLTYTAPSPFTLINGSLGNSGGSHFGGCAYAVVSGAWTSSQGELTANTGYGSWTIGYIVIKPAAGGTTDLGSASSDGTTATSATLTTSIKCAGTSTGTTTTSATLTTSIHCNGSSTGTTTTSGTLTTSIKCHGSSTGTTTTSATLTTSIHCVGSSTGTSTTSASLTTVPNTLAGTSTGTTSSSATLTTSIHCVGSSTGTSSTSATLTAQTRLVGSSTGSSSTAAAPLTTSIRCHGTATGTSTTTATFTASIRLVGTATGTTAIGSSESTSDGPILSTVRTELVEDEYFVVVSPDRWFTVQTVDRFFEVTP